MKINTVQEAERAVEEKQIELMRAQLALESLQSTNDLLVEVECGEKTAHKFYCEALLNYDEDEGDFDTRMENAERMARIENEFDRWNARLVNMHKRVWWENKQAAGK